MSLYEELYKAYGGARQKHFSYRDDSWQFFAQVVKQLRDFLGYPYEPIFRPVLSVPHENMTYSLPGAMEFDPKDGSWHLGVVLTIEQAPNTLPKFRGLLHLVAKKAADAFVLQPEPPGGEKFTIKTKLQPALTYNRLMNAFLAC